MKTIEMVREMIALQKDHNFKADKIYLTQEVFDALYLEVINCMPLVPCERGDGKTYFEGVEVIVVDSCGSVDLVGEVQP